MIKKSVLCLIIATTALFTGCEKNNDQESTGQALEFSDYSITFVELGSVNCTPCKMMQTVLDSIKDLYPDDVQVIFYDIWTVEGKNYGDLFNVRVIPTQIFLDNEGIEFYRHEGYFEEDAVIELIEMKLSLVESNPN